MIAAGEHPVVLATTMVSTEDVRLLYFTGAGIGADPATLKGKRVGLVKNTVGDIYLSRLLAKAGLNQSDVSVVHARPADLKSLLLSGELDAATLWDPFVTQPIREYRGGVQAARVKDRG